MIDAEIVPRMAVSCLSDVRFRRLVVAPQGNKKSSKSQEDCKEIKGCDIHDTLSAITLKLVLASLIQHLDPILCEMTIGP